MMLRAAKFTILVAAGFVALVPVHAAPGGRLGVLPQGTYCCGLPGDAASAVVMRDPSAEFRVINGSGYETDEGEGVYLLTGQTVTFTRGPLKGVRYERTGPNRLRALAAAETSARLICLRTSIGAAEFADPLGE